MRRPDGSLPWPPRPERSGTGTTTTSEPPISLFCGIRAYRAGPGRLVHRRVSHSTLGACLGSQAYMCFYVKRHLDYKPYVTPSYVVTREQEAVKEKEREREKELARMREVDDELRAFT